MEQVASRADLGRKTCHGASVWSAIRTIQQNHQGLRPVPAPAIRNENGGVCKSATEQLQRWQQHFEKVLNVRSCFDMSVFDSVHVRSMYGELDDLPSMEELQGAIRCLRNHKAAGASGILPEMVKCGGAAFRECFLSLICKVWNEGSVPKAWKDADLVPIPKKGDLSICDNWRGIALLDVAGKVVGRLIQNRLQVAEQELPDSQCGFRRGRSCTDQIFSLLQITEKLYEHRKCGFILFIDLRKAYDSVPREALWRGLQCLGVPPKLILLVAAFHAGMMARVRFNGEFSGDIAVNNGLRQGCSISPVLFNLYFALVLERWRAAIRHRCPEEQFQFLFNMSGRLYPRARSRSTEASCSDLEFADDAGLVTTSRASAQLALELFHSVSSEFGLSVNFAKTKFIVAGVGASAGDGAALVVAGQSVQSVSSFVYLGCAISPDSRIAGEIDRRLANAARAFGSLQCVFQDTKLSLRVKRMLYSGCVLSLLLYGSECWPLLKRDEARLDSFHHQCLRSVLGVSRLRQQLDHLHNVELRRLWGDTELVSDMIRRRRLEWLGHVARMPDDRIPKQLCFGWLEKSRPPEGPRLRWKDRVADDIKRLRIPSDWYALAQDRPAWRAAYSVALPSPPPRPVVLCSVCDRSFGPSGFKRHKCTDQRELPVHLQRGAKQCLACYRWFRSAGGLSVHKCNVSVVTRPAAQSTSPPGGSATVRHAIPGMTCCVRHCADCDRCFLSDPGFQRHNCSRGRRKIDREKCGFVCHCGRRFRRPQDLARHRCAA